MEISVHLYTLQLSAKWNEKQFLNCCLVGSAILMFLTWGVIHHCTLLLEGERQLHFPSGSLMNCGIAPNIVVRIELLLYTPTHFAVGCDRNEAVARLLSCSKCNPNVLDMEGDAPLHIAVRKNNTAALSQLLAHEKYEPNIQNRDTSTPLQIAVVCEQNEAVAQPLSCGKCNLYVKHREDDTPLHIAVRIK